MTTPAKTLTAGLLQFTPVFGNIAAYIEKIDSLLNDKQKTADIGVLPGLASSGFNLSSKEEAMQSAESLHNSRFIQYLTRKAAELNTFFVSGIKEREENRLYNGAVLSIFHFQK